ncbi:MAG TPA: ABC transporter permease [Rectinemataceae bacterium]|nr:ABC transporter permease [Rectinemataceae bacterium]
MGWFKPGLRLALSGPLDIVLAVVLLSVGIGALAGAMALLHGNDEYRKELPRNPLAREIAVSGGPSLADAALVMEAVPGLDGAFQYSLRRFEASVASPSKAVGGAARGGGAVLSIAGMAVSSGFFKAWGLPVAEGIHFGDRKLRGRSDVAVAGSGLRSLMLEGADPVGRRVILDGKAFEIVGELKPDPWKNGFGKAPFDDMIFTPTSAAVGRPELAFMAEPGQDVASVAKRLQRWLDKNYGAGAARASLAIEGYATEIRRCESLLSLFALIAAAAAAASSAALYSIMSRRLLARSRSFGMIRALGASSRSLFADAMIEAAAMAGMGALLSLVLSPLVFGALGASLSAVSGLFLPLRLEPAWLLASTFLIAALSILPVAFPALAAARADIAESLPA